MSRKKFIAIAVTAIVAAIAGTLFGHAVVKTFRPPPSPKLASATLIEPARPLPAFELVDHENRAFTNAYLAGRWSFVFFGFTNCPDACPSTLTLLAQVEKALAQRGEVQRPRVVLISVDPERDTPEQLSKYVTFFSPDFVGLTGSQEAIDELTRQLGVAVAITPDETGGYTVDHWAGIFLVDPAGALRALFSAPHAAASITEDYVRIVNSSSYASDG